MASTALLIDADRHRARTLADVLERAGFVVLTEVDAGWGASALATRQVSIVFCAGPLTTGVSKLVDRLNGAAARVPVVALGGQVPEELRGRAEWSLPELPMLPAVLELAKAALGDAAPRPRPAGPGGQRATGIFATPASAAPAPGGGARPGGAGRGGSDGGASRGGDRAVEASGLHGSVGEKTGPFAHPGPPRATSETTDPALRASPQSGGGAPGAAGGMADLVTDRQSRAEQDEVEARVDTAFSARAGEIGSLGAKPYAELLVDLHRSRHTGALYLASGEAKKVIFFRTGQPLTVRSNVMSEALGRILVRNGVVSEEECERSLREVRATGRRQGTVLIEMGSVTPHQLQVALARQLEDKFLDVFNWSEGRYLVDSRVPVPAAVTTLELPLPRLIDRGVRAWVGAERLMSALQDDMDSVGMRGDHPLADPADFLHDDDERAVLAALASSEVTLSQVVQTSAVGVPRVLAVAYLVRVLGLVRFLPQSALAEMLAVKARASSPHRPATPGAGQATAPRSSATLQLPVVPKDGAALPRRLAPPAPPPDFPGADDADPRGAPGTLSVAAPPPPAPPPPAPTDDDEDTDAEARAATTGSLALPAGLLGGAAAADLGAALDDAEPTTLPRNTSSVRELLEASALAELGERHLRAGRWAEARDAFASAARRAPDEAGFGARAAWARLLAADGDDVEAAAAVVDLEAAVTAHPRLLAPQLLLGLAYADRRDPRARALLEHVLGERPGHAGAVAALGRLRSG